MPDLPPFPDGWSDLTLIVSQGPDGIGGTLTIGGAAYHVRGWHRAASGVLKAEVQAIRDPEWEAYLERATRHMEAG